MDKLELERRINDINQSNDTVDGKKRRIETVNNVYQNIQTQNAEAAKQKQEQNEAALKNRLKQSYLANPAATEEDFEKDYPNLKSDYLRAEALKRETEIKQAQSRLAREVF